MLIVITLLIVGTLAIATLSLAPRIGEGRVIYQTDADRPCPFGYRMAWLAIRTRDTRRVVDALGLQHAAPANWKTGIGVVYDRRLSDDRLFVSPPVNGWTFVVGLSLPQPVGRGFVDKATPLLQRLGSEFIEVQYFMSYPAIDHHAWARLIDGKLVRAFAIGDEGILWNHGKPSKEEQTLGLKLFELRGVRGRRGDAGGELILYPTEEHVMRLASRWSIDPTTLDTIDKEMVEAGLGWVGHTPAGWRAERLRQSA